MRDGLQVLNSACVLILSSDVTISLCWQVLCRVDEMLTHSGIGRF